MKAIKGITDKTGAPYPLLPQFHKGRYFLLGPLAQGLARIRCLRFTAVHFVATAFGLVLEGSIAPTGSPGARHITYSNHISP